MKIAICFFGKTVNKGGLKDFEKGFNNIKNQVMQYNPDIFIHSWNSNNSNVLKKYKPKKILLENPPFKKSNNFGTRCMFYSIKKSIELKNEYEKQYNFKYDIVLLSRFDISGRADRLVFDINDNMDDIYFSRDFWKNGVIVDHWCYCNSLNMDIISKIFDNIENYIRDKSYKYGYNNHLLFQYHLVKNNLIKKIKFKYCEYSKEELNHLNLSEKMIYSFNQT